MKRTLLLFPFFLLCPALCLADPNWNGYGSQGTAPPLETRHTAVVADATATKYYLLRTGFLLEGTATAEGKNFAIRTDFGTIHVPVTNVEFVGQTKQDIYRYKKNSVDAANSNELMKLAEWCLSHRLTKESLFEYGRALHVAPNSTLAGVIRRRLQEAAAADKAGTDDSGNELEKQRLSGAAILERKDETELSRWASNLPKSVVEEYAKKVQQALLAGCAAADCHGTNSENRFKLAKPSQLIGTTTYENLQAIMPWINLDYPTDSPILNAMVTFHGGAKPAYSVESKQYDNVIQWIQLAAKELPLDYHQAAGKPEKADATAIATQNHPPQNSPRLPPAFSDLAKSATTPNTAVTANDVQQKSQAPSDDPFDPSVFNARYHGSTLR